MANLRFHLTEIDKVDKTKDISDMTPLERVSVYFRYANDPNKEELIEKLIDSGDKAIILAENIFRELTADDIACEKMPARQKFLWRYGSGLSAAREQGLEQGRSGGEVSKALEMVKVMKDKSYSIDEISELMGLKPEEVEKI